MVSELKIGDLFRCSVAVTCNHEYHRKQPPAAPGEHEDYESDTEVTEVAAVAPWKARA